MKQNKKIFTLFAIAGIMWLTNSCRKDYYFEPPPPRTAQQTSTLEANLVSAPPDKISSSYWKSADYFKVNLKNVSTSNLYEDGKLNMTGIYSGLSSFNEGKDPGLILKAAYDYDKLYILAEWTDSDMDLSQATLFMEGLADPLKPDSTGGWTSQRNSDKLSFAFEIQSASAPSGNFNTVGCAASCHNDGNGLKMHPQTGKVDIWNWNLAISSPLGYMKDMVADASNFTDDTGQKMFTRNTAGNRSIPAYEWDGTAQNITLPNGQSALLDPAFYLYNKMPFSGNPERGDSIYHLPTAPGHCATCHGEVGEGGEASFINSLSLNKKSRASLKQSMDGIGDMATYWLPLSDEDKNDIIAYIRGLSGVPGNYLSKPDGSNADITVLSNITPVQITNAMNTSSNKHGKYQLLIVRKLKTNNADDIQFDLSANKTYKFGIALMDNDGKNHIGSLVETLTFK